MLGKTLILYILPILSGILSPSVTVSFYSIQSRPSNLIDVLYFKKKNNKRTINPVNCFLHDDASAGMRSPQTSIVIKRMQERWYSMPFFSGIL